MPSTGTKVLTVSELSEYLRVHRSTIYRLLKKGQLPGNGLRAVRRNQRRTWLGQDFRPRTSRRASTPSPCATLTVYGC